jgi:hypothetical protein
MLRVDLTHDFTAKGTHIVSTINITGLKDTSLKSRLEAEGLATTKNAWTGLSKTQLQDTNVRSLLMELKLKADLWDEVRTCDILALRLEEAEEALMEAVKDKTGDWIFDLAMINDAQKYWKKAKTQLTNVEKKIASIKVL